jgi:type III secretion protein V
MKGFKFAYGGDVGMGTMVVAILSLIVLPLPTFVIDVLLAVNISVSVLLLVVTLYIPNAVALSTFPSLLLFTTLLRLGLNIASTKLILLHADAGHIIDAFGNLVVGGNLIVGLVVFLIITVVQFIVITKGSERVAEVGARFTLDAMPGKQMSIDADLRAGHLTGEEARHKRGMLAMESQLHGGMDGAMKFVKGDAIAGLAITAINMLAGIVIGIVFHDMTAADAANRFAILSIGDAMVSQIPSLLISVAAGMMITRVGEGDEAKPSSMGQDISAQLVSNPKALSMAAALLLGFAAIPGFPWYVFVAIAALFVMMARKLASKRGGDSGAGVLKDLQREGARGEAPGIALKSSAFSHPLAVTLSTQLGAALDKVALNTAFEKERASMQEQLGLPFPGIRIWTRPTQPEFMYEVLVHDVPAGGGTVVAGQRLVVSAPPEWAEKAEPGAGALGEMASRWIAEAAAVQTPDVVSLTHEEIIARHASGLLREYAHTLLGIQEVQWILERMGADYPGLVGEVQKVLPLQRISEVLKRLLEEQVSIRNMRAIFESLIVWGPKEKDVLLLTEYVRGDLGRYLSHRATNGSGVLAAVLLDPALEKFIREAIKPTPAGNFLALPPEHTAAITQRITDVTGEVPRPGLAVVTSMDIRRYVRRMIESRVRWLEVYSYQELGAHARLDPVGRVSL